MGRFLPGDIARANVQWRFITTPTSEARYIACGRTGALYTAGGYRYQGYDTPQRSAFGLATSPDGVEWKPAMLGNWNYYNDPQWMANIGRTIVVGGWLLRDDEQNSVPNNTDWKDGMSVAVSEDGGNTWSMPTIKPRPWWGALMTVAGAAGNGRFVAAGYAVPGMYIIAAAANSPQNWRMSNLSPGAPTQYEYPDGRYPSCLTFMDGLFVLHVNENYPAVPTLNDSVSRLYTSSDGVNWTERSMWPEGWGARAMASDGTKWVAVSVGGAIHVSHDQGRTWSAAGTFHTTPNAPFPWSMSWANGTWVLGTQMSPYFQQGFSSLFWSANGINWNPVADPFNLYAQANSSGSGSAIWDVYHDGDRWWATGVGVYSYENPDTSPYADDFNLSYCQLATSVDGQTWEQVPLHDVGGVRVLTGIRKIPAR